MTEAPEVMVSVAAVLDLIAKVRAHPDSQASEQQSAWYRCARRVESEINQLAGKAET